MSLRSTPPSQSPIVAMSPKPKSTSSMAATSPWTPPQTKSPHWSKDSSVLHARALRRAKQGEAAVERDGAQRCIGQNGPNRSLEIFRYGTAKASIELAHRSRHLAKSTDRLRYYLGQIAGEVRRTHTRQAIYSVQIRQCWCQPHIDGGYIA